ncbi:MAG: tol-pal system-associated acyl-CoA thioesterase [Burkholderiales bacterium]
MSVAGPPQGARPPREGRRAAPLGREPSQPFRFAIRVYYEDTDAAGVVYYANYLRFMERARTEWLEAIGFPLARFEREHGVVFVVHRCEIDFRQPARLNDWLDVTVEPVDRGPARLVARQEVRRGADVLTSARVTLACVDSARWRPARIPAPLATRMENPA